MLSAKEAKSKLQHTKAWYEIEKAIEEAKTNNIFVDCGRLGDWELRYLEELGYRLIEQRFGGYKIFF